MCTGSAGRKGAKRVPNKSTSTMATLQVEEKAAAASGSTHPDEMLVAAVEALRHDRIAQAEEKLIAILDGEPTQPDALHFLGIVRHAQQRSDEGIALICRSLELQPTQPGAWNNLGNVLVECQRLDAAAEAYERSVGAAEESGEKAQAADAWNNLGTLRRKRHDPQAAEAACREALRLKPEFGDAWYNLSLALLAQKRIHEGLIANGRAITLWPRHLQGRDQVIRALLLLGERDQAAALYREWLAEEPDNPVVQHQLAACLGEAAPARASDAYVETVFDSFAKSFDAKLESLNYRAPELVAEALAQVLPAPSRQFDIVDLGCGTGLAGLLVRPWARRLAGCDLSVGMLRKARSRDVYDVLHKAELVHYLSTQPGAFDVAVCVDTLCYFGALDECFAAAAVAMRPQGWLVLTVEALAETDDAPTRLNPNGRYAHSAAHLRAASAAGGWQLHQLRPVTLRHEAGRPVAGHLVTLQRAAA